MQFTTTPLASNLVLVEGTDVRGNKGQTTVDGTEWNFLADRARIEQAHSAFDDKVEEFFAELTEAAGQLEQAHRVELDPLLFIVEQEESEGHAPQAQRTRALQPGTVILRAIEQGHTDRLLWVNGELVLTAAPVAAVATPAPGTPEWDALHGLSDAPVDQTAPLD